MVAVRFFDERDAEPLACLMIEMARYYGASIRPELDVVDDVVRQSKAMDIVVAHDRGDLVGFATFASLYPIGGLVSFTYVQQVYVSLAARRQGVANRLLGCVARVAKDRGSARVEWSTGRDNAAARALYDGLGAVGSDKVQYALEGSALDQLAARFA
jgi:GNAT superfamily N-acetyltransferase